MNPVSHRDTVEELHDLALKRHSATLQHCCYIGLVLGERLKRDSLEKEWFFVGIPACM